MVSQDFAHAGNGDGCSGMSYTSPPPQCAKHDESGPFILWYHRRINTHFLKHETTINSSC